MKIKLFIVTALTFHIGIQPLKCRKYKVLATSFKEAEDVMLEALDDTSGKDVYGCEIRKIEVDNDLYASDKALPQLGW